jgi:beta-lactamase regulating signal transducer with metallopeptidase domain
MTFYEPLVEWSRWGWPLLVNHLWQASLFSLFVLAVCAPLKQAPARVRHSLLLFTFVKFVLPGAALALLVKQVGIDAARLFASDSGGTASGLALSPFLSPVASPPVVFQAIEQATPGDASTAVAYVAAAQDQSYWYGLLTFIWLTGCAVLFGSWLRQRRLLSAVVRAGEISGSGREFEALQRVRSWLGLRRKVALVISPQIAEPGVWRVLRPILVLPEGISARLNDGELETVMMHELVHVERWDNLVGILQRIVCCLLWFHPLVWLLDRQLLAEREQSCDDTVIRLGGDSEVYVNTIKKICRHSIGWEQPGLSSATGANLKKRIRRITATDARRSPSVLHRALFGIVAIVLFFLSAIVGGVDGGEASALNAYTNGIDYRFVVASSEGSQENGAATTEGRFLTSTPPQQALPAPHQTIQNPSASVHITRSPDLLVTDLGIPPEVNQLNQTIQPRQEEHPPRPTSPVQSADIRATFIQASAVQVDLTEFVGRYEVDPAKVENFVLDITLERGELWLKPSHAPKRKLLLSAETRLSDLYSDFRFTVLRDQRGRVVGLTLDSWNSDITARKLPLAQPSLKGNTTFVLSGYPNARIVAVAGSFNNWNQSQYLFARVGGQWVCRINLPPGKHEYKFIVDGDWLVDPRNNNTKRDERGHENSVLTTD